MPVGYGVVVMLILMLYKGYKIELLESSIPNFDIINVRGGDLVKQLNWQTVTKN